MSNKVLIVGDIHGEFDKLRWIISKVNAHTKLDACIQVGDYGIWTDFSPSNIVKAYRTKYEVPVYFCDGNHENHAALDQYERGKVHQLTDKLFFCAFGSTLTFGKYTFLFCGGADSIDKSWRIPFKSWWATECISLEDLNYLPEEKIDVVISHTAPQNIADTLCEQLDHGFKALKCEDISCSYLSRIHEKYKPVKWFFGHWHMPFYQTIEDTQYYGLDMLGSCISNFAVIVDTQNLETIPVDFIKGKH